MQSSWYRITEAVRLTVWFRVTTDTLFLREWVYIETQTKPKTFCNLNLLSGSDISPEEDVMVIQAKDTASVMKILHNSGTKYLWMLYDCGCFIMQGAPFATEPDISLIIQTPMTILQWNLIGSRFVVWEMKKNVSVVCVCSSPNCCDTEQRFAS
jgi:hypothetical protein